jgi:phosphotransferase system HPr-like phosphotransfer protein
LNFLLKWLFIHWEVFANICKKCKDYSQDVHLIHPNGRANCKSILEVIGSLPFSENSLQLAVEGTDEAARELALEVYSIAIKKRGLI